MALLRTPLDPSRLSVAAQRALAPGPTRMMAARGLAPLPRPGEIASVLYQLALDPDPAIGAAAAQSGRELPERVLEGALSDEEVDARVLDYFTDLVKTRPALLHRIILNRATADETIARLAAQGGAADVDLIAQNEQRLLRHPEIIAAMFHNPRGRMSTVDRAVELAVRSDIKVSGIATWDSLVAAVVGGAQGGPRLSGDEADRMFAEAAEAVAAHPETEDASEIPDADAEVQADASGRARMPPISAMTIPMKIRLATMGNAFARATLVRDPNRVVATAAIRAPGVRDVEAAKYAGNHGLSDDVIKYIASRRDWVKTYGVKLALIQNPKTPIADAVRLMPHLRERDLRNIARSKGIPSAVVAQARKLLAQRTTEPKK